jgi:hypothetical protein
MSGNIVRMACCCKIPTEIPSGGDCDPCSCQPDVLQVNLSGISYCKGASDFWRVGSTGAGASDSGHVFDLNTGQINSTFKLDRYATISRPSHSSHGVALYKGVFEGKFGTIMQDAGNLGMSDVAKWNRVKDELKYGVQAYADRHNIPYGIQENTIMPELIRVPTRQGGVEEIWVYHDPVTGQPWAQTNNGEDHGDPCAHLFTGGGIVIANIGVLDIDVGLNPDCKTIYGISAVVHFGDSIFPGHIAGLPGDDWERGGSEIPFFAEATEEDSGAGAPYDYSYYSEIVDVATGEKSENQKPLTYADKGRREHRFAYMYNNNVIHYSGCGYASRSGPRIDNEFERRKGSIEAESHLFDTSPIPRQGFARIFSYSSIFVGAPTVLIAQDATNTLSLDDCKDGTRSQAFGVVDPIPTGTSIAFPDPPFGDGKAHVLQFKDETHACKPAKVKVTFSSRTACSSCFIIDTGKWATVNTDYLPGTYTLSNTADLSTDSCTKHVYRTASAVNLSKLNTFSDTCSTPTSPATATETGNIKVSLTWDEEDNEWKVNNVRVIEKSCHFNTGTGDFDLNTPIPNGYDLSGEVCVIGCSAGYYAGTVTVNLEPA